MHFVQLISLVCASVAGAHSSSCDYLWRHVSRYLLPCVVSPKMCRHWRGTNGPDGCRRNRSKLTVYPGIRQLQPPTGIKGNSWIFHLDLNNKKEMSKHIPTHKWNHMAAILPGFGLKPAIRGYMEKAASATCIIISLTVNTVTQNSHKYPLTVFGRQMLDIRLGSNVCIGVQRHR